ncbi:helix-turn-helix domain-containing protein [Actinokineospora guangxiensis]|uniref:Helix-turn-helix domain-containing protein n=1 Tax=Actinokineospora guangxiensis TaxID=1490288 RepID=A0ABW0EQK5_9PSEU
MAKKPEKAGPVVPRVRLSMELRQARDHAGLTQQQVAEALEWSLSKVIRIENGAVRVSITDLRAALALFGISEPARVDELLELSRQAREKEWWDKYRKDAQQGIIDLAAYEASASVIHQYQSMVVPGLLQTTAYARAVIGNFDDEATTEGLLALRRDRQRAALRGDGRERVFILDEAVLLRTVVGPDDMLEQLAHLVEVNRMDGVSIHVLPLSSGPHRAIGGSFQVLGIGSTRGASYIAYTPAGWFEQLIKNESAVAEYRVIFDELLALSSTSDQLEGLLDQVGSTIHQQKERG